MCVLSSFLSPADECANFGGPRHCLGVLHAAASAAALRGRGGGPAADDRDGKHGGHTVDWFHVESDGSGGESRDLRRHRDGRDIDRVGGASGSGWAVDSGQKFAVHQVHGIKVEAGPPTQWWWWW